MYWEFRSRATTEFDAALRLYMFYANGRFGAPRCSILISDPMLETGRSRQIPPTDFAVRPVRRCPPPYSTGVGGGQRRTGRTAIIRISVL
jgi:hypothetical protein